MDGWMGRWVDRWMDGWMDGWIEACMHGCAMSVCALHLHAGARLLGVRVARVVHRTYLVEGVAREVDPLEQRTHRAAEPATIWNSVPIAPRNLQPHVHVHAHAHVHVHVTCACTCAHRAAEPVLGHHAKVRIASGARILLERVGQVELPVLRALAQRLNTSRSRSRSRSGSKQVSGKKV